MVLGKLDSYMLKNEIRTLPNCGSQQKGKFLKRWEYQTTWSASWEISMQVKKQQLEPNMEKQTGSKSGKEYLKTMYSPCLFNLYTEYIMRNAGLNESQAGIKIARRNINNLRYTDDTTLMVESKEELKSFLMKVKEKCEKAGLKLNIQKTNIKAFGPITSWQIDGEKVEAVMNFIFLGSKITVDSDCSLEITMKDACSLEGKLWQT